MNLAVEGGTIIYRLDTADPMRVIALNNASETETSRLDELSFARLLASASHAHGIGAGPDAFLIAMEEISAYENANFAWFRARYRRFVYIDRIVVAEQARGRGLARRLYGELFEAVRADGHILVGCEVNIHPANPVSDAFHASMGFREAGQAELGAAGKRVRYLVRDIS